MPNPPEPQETKKTQILDAAYKRFSHYGYSKTTMKEIASDLSMSKALLYYYFPDKSQL
jgi:AcrR family transcriptional regulator